MNSTKSSVATVERADEGTAVAHSARLQRAIVRLIFSFHGQHPAIDDNLKRLRALLKTAPRSASVFSLIDEVVEQIVAADVGRTSIAPAARQLSEFLGQLELVGDVVADSRALQRRLADITSATDLERLSGEASLLVNRALKPRAAGSVEDDPTGRNGREILLALVDSMRIEEQTLKATLATLRLRIDKMRTGKAWLDAAEEIARVLSSAVQALPNTSCDNTTIEMARAPLATLLDLLDTDEGASAAATVTRKQIYSATNAEDLVAVARAFGEFINSARAKQTRESAELGGFLRDVTKRLDEFKSYLKQSGCSHDDSVRSAVALQNSMNEQVGQMQERIEQETELSELKLFVLDEVNGLKSALSSFVDNERQRHVVVNQSAHFTMNRLNTLESEMAELRVNLIEQQALNQLDVLTGVRNRLGYTEGISREFSRWQRHGGELSLAIFDLDLFKNINDQYGHATGDKVLTAVASLFRKHVRNGDLVCRIGGEEFVVIMPETTLEAAVVVAEKLREVVAASQFRLKDQPVPVTVSCGVAAFHQADIVDEVFERADQALYRAKALGRNRYCIEEMIGSATTTTAL